MKKILAFCFIFIFFSSLLISCNPPEVPISSILEPSSLRSGSVSLYNLIDQSGAIMGMVTNHIIHETSEILLIQDTSGADYQEILRIRLNSQSLQLNKVEIVKPVENKEESIPKQTLEYSLERNRNFFYLSDFTKDKKKHSRHSIDTLVMEQETMIYLINSFPFEKSDSISIRYINTRLQKTGIETIKVIGKEIKKFNNREYSSYKVSFSDLNVTAWYMEEKPHILLEVDFPSHKISLIDWNEL